MCGEWKKTLEVSTIGNLNRDRITGELIMDIRRQEQRETIRELFDQAGTDILLLRIIDNILDKAEEYGPFDAPDETVDDDAIINAVWMAMDDEKEEIHSLFVSLALHVQGQKETERLFEELEKKR